MNIDPREFELQERALREDAAYREVAQALRRSPGEPPADFAASVAASAAVLAGVGAAGPVVREGLIEHWLLRALAVVLGLSCIGALALYGGEWLGGILDGFDAIVPAVGGPTALNWVLAAGACMALSWAFTQGAPRFVGRSRR